MAQSGSVGGDQPNNPPKHHHLAADWTRADPACGTAANLSCSAYSVHTEYSNVALHLQYSNKQ